MKRTFPTTVLKRRRGWLSGLLTLVLLITFGCSGSESDRLDAASDATQELDSGILPDAAGETDFEDAGLDAGDVAEVAPDVVENPVTVNVVPFVRLTASDTLHEAFP